MANVITFYDIPSRDRGVAWNPNTWKTRYSLNFKGLPYKTEWIEYPDIEALCKKIGAAPTTTKPDGRPHYTLPVIYDPSTGTAVSESARIADYLDATYPDTPLLFPRGSRVFQYFFVDAVMSMIGPMWQFVLPGTRRMLIPRSEVYFRQTREAQYFGGMSMEEVEPQGERRKAEWEKLKGLFQMLDGWMQEGKADGPYVMGSSPSFADFFLAATFQWLRNILGDDNPEWKDILTWQEGRWAVYAQHLQKYETVL